MSTHGSHCQDQTGKLAQRLSALTGTGFSHFKLLVKVQSESLAQTQGPLTSSCFGWGLQPLTSQRDFLLLFKFFSGHASTRVPVCHVLVVFIGKLAT